VLALLALLALAPGATAGGKPLEILTKDAFVAPEGGLPFMINATVYQTGFETVQAFAVGAIEPQNGYTATGVNNPWASVAAVNPSEGAQHLRLVFDVLAGLGTTHIVLGPNLPQPPNAPSQVKMMVNISNSGGSIYDVVGQAPSQGFLSWRVRFQWDTGAILVLDDLGAGLVFVDTGVTWDPGVYRELKVQFDPAASEIRYFYDGNLIYTGFNIFAGTSIEQLVWFNDNFQLGGETADFDAVNWIDSASDPTPATKTSWGGVKNTYRH
jgi:hypothetical protein